MSRKNHKIIDGRLIQTDKTFSQLKQRQKEKINEWLYTAYQNIYDKNSIAPDKRYDDNIVFAVYEKIEEAEIWIPLGEIYKYYYSRKSKYRKRYEKQISNSEE